MPVSGKVHFILNRLEKQACCFGILVIIKSCSIQISDFLIKLAL